MNSSFTRLLFKLVMIFMSYSNISMLNENDVTMALQRNYGTTVTMALQRHYEIHFQSCDIN